ncbi:uncharacterized protein LOC116853202 isoform X3 [Odontomachus brunneus]|uniref:uncharacterized protein LOC116853202 isoform X3 n=1 Tax=Odontomachus brunneus TaxID=486640 RepID=UPI0013F24650|nr:uncharacterized protein LOC116853202 isoform X3 [Odontomachus brunneus]
MRNLEAIARILRSKTMRSNMADQKQPENSRTGQSRRRTCQEHGDEDCPSENEREFESLEYEEDVYYSKLTTTPSFDDIDEVGDGVDELVVHCWRDSNGEIDEIVVDDGNLTIETEFVPEGSGSRDCGSGGGRRKRRSVRVIFQDLSKPYLAKISNSQNYKKFLELVKGEDASLHSTGSLSPTSDNVANELQGLSLEEQERQKAEWSAELAKVEEEIQTLRHVLASKVRVAQELKRKLGISVWKELTDDVNQGLKNVKESHVHVEALISLTFGWVLIQLSERRRETRSVYQGSLREHFISKDRVRLQDHG